MNIFKNIFEIVNKKPLSIFYLLKKLKKQLFTFICLSNYLEKHLFQPIKCFVSLLFRKLQCGFFSVLKGSL